MTYKIRFTKMHGTGNDYIYINNISQHIEHPEQLAQKLSKTHTGIGSDGLVLIGSSECADFSMRIFNADGSEAKMCGNASRCVGKFLVEHGLTDSKEITLETLSGIKKLTLHFTDQKVAQVSVDMGTPVLNPSVPDPEETEAMIAKKMNFKCKLFAVKTVSMGNLHLVLFVEDVERVPLHLIGPILEHHPLFPDRINVEFAQVLNRHTIRMRVWERGSGITLACGTGACATTAAGVCTGQTEREVEIIMDGGSLNIHWDPSTNNIRMRGEAVTVFEGEIEI